MVIVEDRALAYSRSPSLSMQQCFSPQMGYVLYIVGDNLGSLEFSSLFDLMIFICLYYIYSNYFITMTAV